MKILFYCDEYPPYQHGGIGSVVRIVAENLVKRGHDIFVVGSYVYGHGLPSKHSINGVTVFRLSHFNYLRFIPKTLRSFFQKFSIKSGLLHVVAEKEIHSMEKQMEKLIIKEKIDCLELTDYVALFSFLTKEIEFKKFPIKTIMRVHGGLYFLSNLSGKPNQVWHKNDINHFKRTQWISATSQFSLNFVIENFPLKEQYCNVIYNPIEEHFLYNNKKEENSKTILFIGKIVKTKGAFSLLKAFNKIAEKHSAYKLIMIGGGDLKKGKNLVLIQFQNRVTFTDYIDRESIVSYIDKASFCIVPSYFENFSLVALEIMARSKALIYTSTTSGPELIRHMENGLLVDPYDGHDIYEKITILIENPALAVSLGLNAYKDITNKFVANVVIDKLEKKYLELMALSLTGI